MGVVYNQYGRKVRGDLLSGPAQTVVAVSVDTTAGSSTVAAHTPPLPAGIAPGMAVSGAGAPAGAHVVSVDYVANTILLDEPVPGTSSGASWTLTPSIVGLSGLRVHLYQTNFAPGITDSLSTYTAAEATFDGYVSKVLAMTLGYINPSQERVARSQLLSWLLAALPVTPNTIYGYWVDDTIGVIMAEKFANAVALAAAGNELAFILQDSYPPDQGAQVIAP